MWFTETPWPPIYFCFLLFILFFVYGISTGRGRAVLIGAIAIGLTPAIYLLEQWIVTDAEVVEEVVLDLADDVQANRPQEVIDRVKDPTGVLQGLIQTGMARYEMGDGLRVTDLKVTVDSGGQTAKAHVRANGSVHEKGNSGSGHHFPSRWHLYFERNNEQWVISSIERLSPVSGEPMPILATRIQ